MTTLLRVFSEEGSEAWPPSLSSAAAASHMFRSSTALRTVQKAIDQGRLSTLAVYTGISVQEATDEDRSSRSTVCKDDQHFTKSNLHRKLTSSTVKRRT